MQEAISKIPVMENKKLKIVCYKNYMKDGVTPYLRIKGENIDPFSLFPIKR